MGKKRRVKGIREWTNIIDRKPDLFVQSTVSLCSSVAKNYGFGVISIHGRYKMAERHFLSFACVLNRKWHHHMIFRPDLLTEIFVTAVSRLKFLHSLRFSFKFSCGFKLWGSYLNSRPLKMVPYSTLIPKWQFSKQICKFWAVKRAFATSASIQAWTQKRTCRIK